MRLPIEWITDDRGSVWRWLLAIPAIIISLPIIAILALTSKRDA